MKEQGLAGIWRRDATEAQRPIAGVITFQVLLWASLVLCGGMLAWLSVAHYQGYNSSMYDTGDMAQAIGSVRRGEPLVFTTYWGNYSRLAGHVELIYFLIAPFYALWPDPRFLLILQAALFALGALPVFSLALRHTQSRVLAYGLVLLYLFYPTAQTSVLFDFHGDTLGMPLLLFMLDALDRRAWRTYWIFVALALSCKVYVALPVAVMGGMLWWFYGERKIGLTTAVVAVAYGAFAFLVLRTLFARPGDPDTTRGLNFFRYYFGTARTVLAAGPDRLFHASVVFGPALLLIWAGWRWLLPGLPVAAGALISTGPGPAYAYWFHHYALAVPFIVMAAITGAGWLQRAGRDRRNGVIIAYTAKALVVVTVVSVFIFNSKRVDTPLNPLFWSGLRGLGLGDLTYGVTQRDAVKDRFLAEQVPPRVPMAASMMLAPHLTNRDTIYTTRSPDQPPEYSLAKVLPQLDAVVEDALFDHDVVTYDLPEISYMLRQPGFGLVAARDGLLLFERNPPAGTALTQRVEVVDAAGRPAPKATFGPAIGLLDTRITPLGGRRFRATFDWLASQAPGSKVGYIAVSRLDGVAQARIVHLPTYALLPTTQWRAGQVVRETFDVEIPADIAAGRYTWMVGWYDPTQPSSYLTDAQSRLAGSQEAAVATVVLP